MSSQVYSIKRCDYPGCSEVEEGENQEVVPVEFLVNMAVRGRRAATITIDLCEKHLDELRGLHAAMRKFDQKLT